ncbi:MAG: hypothetical protein KA319_07065 [Ferruginibacter sp.]|nr:hypothetical protein [Ferruginibacter sp.]
MRKFIIFLLLLSIVSVFIVSCKKSDPTPVAPPINPCDTIVINTIASKGYTITGQALGTITVTSPIGSNFSYSVNGTSFQPSPNFFNLAAGNYNVITKNNLGCKDTATVTILGYGPKYYAVKNIINGYCGPCHLNGAVSGGKNFDDDASITSSWDRIKARAVDNLPTQMPQTPNAPLTAQDKQKITDWVNAGHRTTD